MWYSNLYRRHLLDMHIEDWSEEFLSAFSAEEYVENLKKAQINYAMIYLQSHTGLCYFPTKTATTHKAVAKDPDMIRRVIDLCHENDIRVCGYYSLFHNTREHDEHPDWRIVREDGISHREAAFSDLTLSPADAARARYGLICPNNPEQLQFVYRQIDEMLDYFPLDALFFDMPFWLYTCYCPHCREAYTTMYGCEIPSFSEDTQYHLLSPERKQEYRELAEFKNITMGNCIRKITDYVKGKCPDMPIEHNCAASVSDPAFAGCGEEVAECCDYAGGDLYGNIYNHAFACKFFRGISKHQPFEQMFSRCKPVLRTHTLTKSVDAMKISVASTMAHHGATLVIDAIDPTGTMDSRVYDQVGEVFAFQKPYEPYFTGTPVEDVGIYYAQRSNLSFFIPNAKDCSVALSANLIRNHIPYGVVNPRSDFSKYKYLVAPMTTAMEEKYNEKLIAYVENGGTLFLSGFENPALVEKLTGHTLLGFTEENEVYLAPEKEYEGVFCGFNKRYPLPYGAPSPIVSPGANAQVLATLTLPYTKPTQLRYASIHSNPPGISTDHPMVTVNAYGKGWVIWSAVSIEGKVLWSYAPTQGSDYTEYTQIVLNLLQYVAPQVYSFYTEAPSNVEITVFKNPDSITVNAYLLTDESKSFAIAPFTVHIRTDAAPASVKLLPGGKEIPFVYQNGVTTFETRTLHIFDMYQIEF